jgi:hypothetical protein
MEPAYPILASEISRRGIKKRAIASAIGTSDRTLYSKLRGETAFTWPEVVVIRGTFFPDISADELFRFSETYTDE